MARETRDLDKGDDRRRRRLDIGIYIDVTVAMNFPASFVAAFGG